MGIVARQLPQPVMSSVGASTGTMTQQQPQQIALQQQTNGGTTQGGKKPLSGGSSGVPTPSETPLQNGSNGQGPTPPPMTNAPKYGTLVPNRIFVGGISASTTEAELMHLFSAYGTVKAAKIIQDRAGVSKGYGFITFESEDDARRPLLQDNIVLRDRRLNIAPAIKKQPFGRPPTAPPYDTHGPSDGRSPAPAPHQALQPPMPPFFFGGAPPFYPGAAAYYAPPMVGTAAAQAPVQVSQASQEQAAVAAAQQAVYQTPQVYQAQTGPPQAGPYASMMFPQTIYMPQQYPTMMPYDYAIYGAGPAASVNGGVPSPYGSSGPASNGSETLPRAGPCYGPAPGHTEGTILYAAQPSHHMYHPALDPTGIAPGSIYASADGPYDPMAHQAAAMGHFGPLTTAPFSMTEENFFMERPEASGTPRSFLTATPPSTEQRNTATPVVSLLSLDHQQVKDPASMQGGRRPPQPPPPQTNQQHCNMHPPRHQNQTHYQNHLPQPHQPQHQTQFRRGPSVYHQTNGQYPPQQRRVFSRLYNGQHNTQHTQTLPSTHGPPPRRPRKPQHRSHGTNNPNNEIGAGDAPLPSGDLGAQMEALHI
ncbi:unnamed protein product [Ceutorhynchus assimilis]|uniref:RRM domain-containing protein n=1 Tax=Ceutorhynchus assimilis TaxID=467358 RepID=A0A9P0DJD9_9CUCU|nr:unnamed protein product [Ceutorhynchus assimilis]